MYLEDRTVSLFPVLQMFRDSHVLGDFVVLIYFFMAWWFCDQDTVPSGQSVYSLSAYSFNLSLLRLLPTPPSISHPIFLKWKHLTWSEEEGWWQVKGDYLFISPPGPDSLLSLMVILDLHALRSVCFSYFFPIRLSLFGFVSICFGHINLAHLSVFFLFPFSLYFIFFFIFFVPSSPWPTDQVTVVGHSGAGAISQPDPKLHQRFSRCCRCVWHYK